MLLGNRAWVQQHGLHLAPAQESEVAALELQGHTAVLVAVRGALAGMLAVSDTLKPEAAAVVQQLRRRGVEVWCVSGDTQPPDPTRALKPQPEPKTPTLAPPPNPTPDSNQVRLGRQRADGAPPGRARRHLACARGGPAHRQAGAGQGAAGKGQGRRHGGRRRQRRARARAGRMHPHAPSCTLHMHPACNLHATCILHMHMQPARMHMQPAHCMHAALPLLPLLRPTWASRSAAARMWPSRRPTSCSSRARSPTCA